MGSVMRTARIALRTTPAQRDRCFGLLGAGGDVWAALIEVNRHRFTRCAPPIFGYHAWCSEINGVGVGELSVPAMRSIARRYSAACIETARRKRRGEAARYPRRRRHLFPLRWYRGTFAIDGCRVRLGVARGCPELWVRLSRSLPYPAEAVRSLTLLCEAGHLYLDVTASVAVLEIDLDPRCIAGVDVGIIHPFAVIARSEALLVSGRAVRAEERLHLADTKARSRRMGRKAPKRGQQGSRRWRKLRAAQRRSEVRHRRRVHLAHHQAAKEVVAWAVERRVGTLVIGDPAGIARRDVGRHHNLRLRQWRHVHLIAALADKAAVAGIRVVRVDERGTSSTCPDCDRPVPKPAGRNFSCPACGAVGHRDIVGARNIAARGGGSTTAPAVITHRRAGSPTARRDRRRHRFDARRSCLAPGRPPQRGSRSLDSGEDQAIPAWRGT